MRRNRIQEAWLDFKRKVIPEDAPNIQLQECRRAFYAGAQSSFSVYVSIGDEVVSEDDGVKILEDLRDELAEFPKMILEGRA